MMIIKTNSQVNLTKTLTRLYCAGNVVVSRKNDREANENKSVYKDIHPWKNIVEFREYMHQNIIYNEGGVVAINKPYGLGMNKPKSDSKEFFRTSLKSFVPESNFYFNEALSYLKEKLKMPNLSVVKSPERYTSGVLLLASDETVTKKIRKSFLYGKTIKNPYMHFRCVVDSIPKPPQGYEQVGLKSIETNGKKEYKICKYVKSASLKGEMKSIHANHQTLSHNNELGVSLVDLSVTSAKAHFPRLFMIERGVVILGDTLFSNRIITVLGKRMVSPKPTSNQMHLSPKVCQKLEISVDGDGFGYIPVQLHLRKMTMYNLSKSKYFDIVAPIPPHMTWTCQNLNLNKEN